MTVTDHAQADDWVQIHRIVLTPDQRPANLPAETRAVPLEMRIKGWLVTERAVLSEEVTIRAAIGRAMQGHMIAINPAYGHDFGQAVPELLAAGDDLVALMRTPEET